jgi:topoisomerase-4 subunit A
MKELEGEIKQTKHDIANLTDFAITYFEKLLEKYGKGRERKTIITNIEQIQVQQVVANNAKLYVNYKEGLVGYGMKKEEYVCDCSDIDDIIVFNSEGKFKVVRISEKVFALKDIIHVAVWKKADERTTYNMIYVDGASGVSYGKRFNVTAITRDKEYDLTKDSGKKSKVHYFSVQPNGESEIVKVQLSPACSARIKVFDFDMADIGIKSRTSQGNIVTKYPVRKITQVSVGQSSLGAMKVYYDESTGKLNTESRGRYLGGFDTGIKIIALYKDGSYEISEMDLTKKYDPAQLFDIAKYEETMIINAVYFESGKSWTMVKRFAIETSTLNQKFYFIPEDANTKLYFATSHKQSQVVITYKEGKEKYEMEVDIDNFVDVKGWKALGNKLFDGKALKIEETSYLDETEEQDTITENTAKQGDLFKDITTKTKNGKLKSGDTIEWE